jgi:hypothetical protein
MLSDRAVTLKARSFNINPKMARTPCAPSVSGMKMGFILKVQKRRCKALKPFSQ